jgi:hypothetical protein
MIKKLQENISIFRLVLVLLTLGTVLKSEIDNHYSQIMYAGYLEVPIYVLFFIVYLVVLFFDVSLHLKTRRIKSLFPSIIGLLLILASFSVHYYHYYKIHQKTIFSASSNLVDYETGNIMYSIEFKENNNVVVKGQIDRGRMINYHYGTYTQSDSIIILDSDQPELNISNRFLIRTVNVNGFSERELVQVDENGKEIKNQFQFIIDSYSRFRAN